MSALRNCDWCGKETYSSYCSTKSQAEHDSYLGISPDERRKYDKDARSCVGCGMGFILITYLVTATLFPFFTRNLLGFHDYAELTPWDTTVKRSTLVQPQGNTSNTKSRLSVEGVTASPASSYGDEALRLDPETGNYVPRSGTNSWVCTYCRLVPSQTDSPTCFAAKEPYLHKWLKR